jgi:hypothetical protein
LRITTTAFLISHCSHAHLAQQYPRGVPVTNQLRSWLILMPVTRKRRGALVNRIQQALQALRSPFSQRIRWVCARSAWIASHAQFPHR